MFDRTSTNPGFMSEATFVSQCTPGSQYKEVSMDKYMERAPVFIEKSKSPRMPALKLPQAPSVYSYTVTDTINS
jgi:hypothetical protein